MSKEFNFHGLDNKENEPVSMENLKNLEELLREKYRERLQIFNKANLETNPEPFRFLNSQHCSIILFLLPEEVNGDVATECYILSTPEDRQESFKILTQEDLVDLDSYHGHHVFLTEKMLPIMGFDKSQIILNITDLYPIFNFRRGETIFENNFSPVNFYINRNLKHRIQSLIQNEIYEFKKISETKLSYFAKEAHKFPFSLLDLRPLVELVNDDDFSYQLDQAMAAYHQILFLPCAATLGVVLETLCIKILEINQINSKPSDTQLSKLIEKLRNEKITTRRDNTRLEVAYRMRNMAAHSSPGATLKEDCHFMLNVINTVAIEYFTQN